MAVVLDDADEGIGAPVPVLPDQNSAIIPPAHCSSSHPDTTGVLLSLQPTAKAMDKTPLPHGFVGRKSRIPFFFKLLALGSLASLSFFSYALSYFPGWNRGSRIPLHAANVQARCRSLNAKPGPPPGFHDRTVSDRFVEGTKQVWIRNATIWTGRVQGLEVIQGDVLFMNGLIKVVGHVDLQSVGLSARDEVEIFDAHGAFVTPGYVAVAYPLPLNSSALSA